jgi:hypothetical protein
MRFHLDPALVVEVFARVQLEHVEESLCVVAGESELVARRVEQFEPRHGSAETAAITLSHKNAAASTGGSSLR